MPSESVWVRLDRAFAEADANGNFDEILWRAPIISNGAAVIGQRDRGLLGNRAAPSLGLASRQMRQGTARIALSTNYSITTWPSSFGQPDYIRTETVDGY